MIFVILGTQKIPFPRLLRAVDKLVEAENIREEVIAQTGHYSELMCLKSCWEGKAEPWMVPE